LTDFFPPRTAPSVLTATHYGWLALGILVLAVYGSLIPFHYQPRPLEDAVTAFQHIAFHNPSDLHARGDWIVSVALFLALSFLSMAALCVDRRGKSEIRKPKSETNPKYEIRNGFWFWISDFVLGGCFGFRYSSFELAAKAVAVVLFCAVLSVAIEFAQLFFPPRTVSLNDIIAETLGGAAGTLLWLVAGQRITGWARRVSTPTSLAALAGRLLPGYLVALLIVHAMPFDFAISARELAVKYDEGKIGLIPFEHATAGGHFAFLLKLATNMACFFPVGFLKALSRKRGMLLLFAVGVPALVEILQLLVYSRVCDTTDVFTGAAAILLGWFTAEMVPSYVPNDGFGNPSYARWRRRGILAGLGLAWFAVVLYLNWAPFDFTTDPARFPDSPDDFAIWGLRRMSWLPFVDYYWGSKYQALDNFLRKTISFMPLGVLGALASPRVYRRWSLPCTLAIALFAALAIEAGRYFLPSHAASVTDVGLQCAGAWLGFRLTQYVRALLWAERTLFGYLSP
jgi:glycopeptide antibiotics resistance protein